MALNLGFSHAVLKVRDLPTMLEFYTDVLQFDVVDRGPLRIPNRGDLPPIDAEIIFLSQDPHNHHQLAFIPTREDGDAPGPYDHMAFVADSLGAVRDLANRLTESGVQIRPVSHGNTWSCYFKDPEGNGIEVYTNTPFHVSQPQGQPVDFTMDDDELLTWITDTFSHEPSFRPMEEYEAERAEALAKRD